MRPRPKWFGTLKAIGWRGSHNFCLPLLSSILLKDPTFPGFDDASSLSSLSLLISFILLPFGPSAWTSLLINLQICRYFLLIHKIWYQLVVEFFISAIICFNSRIGLVPLCYFYCFVVISTGADAVCFLLVH